MRLHQIEIVEAVGGASLKKDVNQVLKELLLRYSSRGFVLEDIQYIFRDDKFQETVAFIRYSYIEDVSEIEKGGE